MWDKLKDTFEKPAKTVARREEEVSFRKTVTSVKTAERHIESEWNNKENHINAKE